MYHYSLFTYLPQNLPLLTNSRPLSIVFAKYTGLGVDGEEIAVTTPSVFDHLSTVLKVKIKVRIGH